MKIKLRKALCALNGVIYAVDLGGDDTTYGGLLTGEGTQLFSTIPLYVSPLI
jgi:hypothetical protein